MTFAPAAGAVVVLLAGALGFVYRDQLVRHATHLKGSPRETVAWRPFAAGDPLELHLAVVGDVGDSGSRLRATAHAITEVGAVEPVDGLVLLGDNVYPSGDPSRLPDTVFEPFAEVLDDAELYAVLGNHDVKKGNAAGQVAGPRRPSGGGSSCCTTRRTRPATRVPTRRFARRSSCGRPEPASVCLVFRNARTPVREADGLPGMRNLRPHWMMRALPRERRVDHGDVAAGNRQRRT